MDFKNYMRLVVTAIKHISPFLCIGIVVLQSSTAHAQSMAEWTEISANVPAVLPEGDFLDVDFIGDEGWIVFNQLYNGNGIILYTGDAGTSFSLQDVPELPHVIDMLNPDTGFIGCLSGSVYYTRDGGGQWNYISGSLGSEIYGIDAINDPLSGYVCGQYGRIASFDTNQVLSFQQPFGNGFNNFDLYDIEFPEDTNEAWVCGEKMIAHMKNGIWDSLHVPYCDTYYALSFIDNETGWCTGGQGTFMTPLIVNTTDGINWQEQQHPLIDQWLYDIFFLDQENGWSAGMYILASRDGGETWAAEAENFGNIWYAVSAVDESAVYVVGRNKRILKKDLIISSPERTSARMLPVHPNPFTTSTIIEYEIEKTSSIQFTAYSMQGMVVFEAKEQLMHAGRHKVTWSPAHNIPAGMYYGVLKSEDGMSVVKMVKQ